MFSVQDRGDRVFSPFSVLSVNSGDDLGNLNLDRTSFEGRINIQK